MDEISGIFEQGPDGATRLDDDEASDLLPKHIRTRDELNVWEQENILDAFRWTRGMRTAILSEPAVRDLHRRMFNKTWAWAGTYRKSDKNIGVPWQNVPTEVFNFIENTKYWIDNHVYPIDEIGVRAHHQLVRIHPFANGNGRFSRLWSDILVQQNGRPPFEWKNAELDRAGIVRSVYIRALREADAHHFKPLFQLLLSNRPG